MKRSNKQVWDSLILVFQFGITMIVPIVMCTLFGVWLGDRLGISWIAIPCFFVGALAGFNNIYRMTKKIYSTNSQKEKMDKKNVKKN